MNFLRYADPVFPPVERALDEPNGLLAAGGQLNSEWLLAAYRKGIFPWFDDDAGPALWWSPDPRTILYPDRFKVSRSLAKRLRNARFEVSFDLAFERVIRHCAEPREQVEGRESGTWITSNMINAYCDLHRLGFAHSVETWRSDDAGNRILVGGLYGVSLGGMFFGESMFSRASDASKVALYHLCRRLQDWAFTLIDCQVGNPHLDSLGAVDIPRVEFVELIERNASRATRQGSWR